VIEETRTLREKAMLDQKPPSALNMGFTRGPNIFLMYRYENMPHVHDAGLAHVLTVVAARRTQDLPSRMWLL
jgi:hypothetical protein